MGAKPFVTPSRVRQASPAQAVTTPEAKPAAVNPEPKRVRVQVPAKFFATLAAIADEKMVRLDEYLADLLIRCAKRITERNPDMVAAAAAADERERFAPEPLDEWSRPMLFGHTEVELAIVG